MSRHSITGHDEPYYAKHKIIDLTCPYCQHRLTFLINEGDKSIYSCRCGRWFKKIDWQVTGDKCHWVYEAKEGYEDRAK